MKNQISEDFIGKQTTINFRGDLRMSEPWRSYKDDQIFTIMRKTKSGLYILRDDKGREHPLKKSSIKYFNTKNE